jgi:hypothetical protein
MRFGLHSKSGYVKGGRAAVSDLLMSMSHYTALSLDVYFHYSSLSLVHRWMGHVGSSSNAMSTFLRNILPADFSSFSRQTLSDLNSRLAIAEPGIWCESAVDSIQAGCLAPELAAQTCRQSHQTELHNRKHLI